MLTAENKLSEIKAYLERVHYDFMDDEDDEDCSDGDFDLHDRCGGNVDDAFSLGYDEGYNNASTDIASIILGFLNGSDKLPA